MLGVDYYPEHWPFERLEVDLHIMKNHGIGMIRIGEFLWSKLEPEEGKYDFSILDRTFNFCNKLGIKIVLGTPSPTPPVWLIRKHPDILQKDTLGRERPFGSRRHYCLNSDTYSVYVKKIVEMLAKRYGKDTSMYAWQIDNEFGCEDTAFCYCEKCDRAFQGFLQKKYGRIERLNQVWGTAFWSQDYQNFQQILTPRKTNARLNPTHVLDFYRFSTHSATEFAQKQIELIRKESKAPITHNFMVFFTDIDYYEHQKIYDFLSYDNYQPFEFYNPLVSEYNFDLIWSLKKQNFTVMEQQPGRVNWQERNQYYPAEWLRTTTLQAFEHGAENVVWFRYRSLGSGAEQYHSAIVNYDGNPDTSQRLQVVKQLASQSLTPSKKTARTGIFFDYENVWMHQINYVTKDLNYLEKSFELYSVLRQLGYEVEFFFKDSDLSQYDRVFLPHALWIPEKINQQLLSFRGKIYLTCTSNLKDENNHIRSDKPLGFCLPGLSFRINDFGATSTMPIRFQQQTMEGGCWFEEIEISEGKIIGDWKNLHSSPAILTSIDGRILYIGTCLKPDALTLVLKHWGL